MKKGFLKFLLSICILLSGIYSPLFANNNIEATSFRTIQQISNSVNNNLVSVADHNAVLKGTFDNLDKVLEIEAIEIEEEESEHIFYKKDVEQQQAAISYYLLSVLFLFSYFTNSNSLQRLFNFLPTADRRFVLYQVFRI
ncbi:hypothetical protein SAMN04488007_0592 [Maribacter aquivivus]|uniref:Uncharacterized protein n=1 Tax=Maribacter aquivivus TaxID=228958 RepID=A0A1M6JZ67_9FLAO|nr:hypothetical protein [Maribacter aquivivus]SHJ51892.1 hypothetical protein SAMN04488007_0592 [Maribacter aquivivus]